MSSLSRLPPADARVYNDYLLPSLSLLPNDPEESVRVTYAQALAQLAAAAHRHLLTMQHGDVQQPQQQQGQRSRSNSVRLDAATAGSTSGQSSSARAGEGSQVVETAAAAGGMGGAVQQPAVRYDAEMDAVRSAIEQVVVELVAGPNSSPDIKRGLLSHAGQLGLFFGRRATTDQLLPPLYTCLNDHVEWRLRSSFYGAIAALAPHTGHLDVFMAPYLEQVVVGGSVRWVCWGCKGSKVLLLQLGGIWKGLASCSGTGRCQLWCVQLSTCTALVPRSCLVLHLFQHSC
jgi:phosphoinositide-3-kinase regulatory subunit 4